MQCEQFIAILSKLAVASSNIEKVVTLEELEFLIHLGKGTKEPQCLRTILNDKFGAVSYIEPIQDEYNRNGVWNHTIIINLKDYFNSTAPTKHLADKFFQYTKNPPKKLPTITVEENVPNPEKGN